MIQSMTGYGRAEALFGSRKFTVEIRSLNGKTCDITLKTSIIPHGREMEVRKYITDRLVRGNIDLFVTSENIGGEGGASINQDVVREYFSQIREAFPGIAPDGAAVASILRLPDAVEVKREEMTDECWKVVNGAIEEAVEALVAFRRREGAVLREDVGRRAGLISSWVDEIEKYEKERVAAVRERIISRMEELKAGVDRDRLEQEMIFYIEKLDINEEKVRLRQHCRYFAETMENEEHPGRKLGFIAQEMGREINTTGSKANHVEIQKWVVRMKDELEKIKEQSLNIL